MAVSCVFATWLVLRIGPLAVVRVGTLLWVAFCVTSFFSENTVQVVLSRVGKGFAMGAVSVCIPFYLFEVFVPQARGMGIACLATGSFAGQAIIVIIGIVLQLFYTPWQSFHYAWLAEAGFGGIAFLVSFLMPELPNTLARRNRWPKASQTLRKLLQTQDGFNVTNESAFPLRFSEMFHPQIFRRLVLAIVVQIFGQIASIGLSGQFCQYLCSLCGLTDNEAQAVVIGQYVTMFLASLIPIYFLKNARRKDFLAMGFMFLTACYGAMASVCLACGVPAAAVTTYGPEMAIRGLPASAVLAVGGVVVFFTTILVYPTTLLYTLEILPHEARMTGLSPALCTSWTLSAVFEGLSQIITRLQPFYLFITCSMISFIATFFFLLCWDTREYSFLEGIPYDIDQLLANKVSPYGPQLIPSGMVDEKAESPYSPEKPPSFKEMPRKSPVSRLTPVDPKLRKVSMDISMSEATKLLFTSNTQFGNQTAIDYYLNKNKMIESKPNSVWLDDSRL